MGQSRVKLFATPAGRWALGAGLALALGVMTYPFWSPTATLYLRSLPSALERTVRRTPPGSTANLDEATAPPSQGTHDHDEDADSIALSDQARKSLGLQLTQVELQEFTRTISLPGMVVERPGRSIIEATAPMTGIITRIHLMEGEAVEPGQLLFELRLTHEELVQSQAELLQTAEELDVVALEIQRIDELTAGGALAGKQLLERQYEKQRLEAVLRSKRQALLLHGLDDGQVDSILKKRELLKTLSVFAPTVSFGGEAPPAGTLFQVQNLQVTQGQHVNAGDPLAQLADYSELYIEGEAFERDVAGIARVADQGIAVTAVLETEAEQSEEIHNLKVLYLAPQVNSDTRTLDFFVILPNEKRRDARLENGHRFIAWRFRPGQRMQLRIPVETWSDRIVAPIGAIAQDGVENYVFVVEGSRLERRPVQIEYRDSQTAVIANDGTLQPGEILATSSAQQLHLAVKNRQGGIDPHAGHSH